MDELSESAFQEMRQSLDWSIDFQTFKRNVITALAHSDSAVALDHIEQYLNEPDEVLRETAQWASEWFHSRREAMTE
jgi:hypothetical protein